MPPRAPAAPPRATAADDPGPRFSPVRTRRAFEAVCDQVRRQVADGVLQPGQRLPGERDLAQQFGVSRSGVREALRSLELAGLVEARTGATGGFFIRSSGAGSASDSVTQAVRDMVALGQVPTASITEARIELTCVAIRLAARRATPAELDALEADVAHHAELFRRGRGSRNTKAVTEFYRLLAQATHNEVIVMLVDALAESVRTLLARVDPQPMPEIVAVRRKVVKHLRAGDAEEACAVMSRHLRRLNRYLEERPWTAAPTSTSTPTPKAARAAATGAKR
jgi:DNA-binding FadR family transcriptional regulator